MRISVWWISVRARHLLRIGVWRLRWAAAKRLDRWARSSAFAVALTTSMARSDRRAIDAWLDEQRARLRPGGDDAFALRRLAAASRPQPAPIAGPSWSALAERPSRDDWYGTQAGEPYPDPFEGER